MCELQGAAAREFERLRRTVTYQPGQCVFYEGHPVLGLYVLCAGRLKLTRVSARGDARLVAIVDPAMLIESQGFQDGATHEVTCEALERSQVCIIDRDRYLALLARDGALAVRLLKHMSQQLGTTLAEIDRLAFSSARERLARVLLGLAERYGCQTEAGWCISLHLRREELAQMAAITIETAVRLLKALESEKVLRLSGRTITVIQPEQLRRIACMISAVAPSS